MTPSIRGGFPHAAGAAYPRTPRIFRRGTVPPRTRDPGRRGYRCARGVGAGSVRGTVKVGNLDRDRFRVDDLTLKSLLVFGGIGCYTAGQP